MAKEYKFWALMIKQEKKDQFLLLFKEHEDDDLCGFYPLQYKSIAESQHWADFLNGKPIEGLMGAISKRNEPFSLVLTEKPAVREYKNKDSGKWVETLDFGNPHKNIIRCEK